MPHVMGTYLENDGLSTKMLWFLRDGTNALFRQLQSCDRVKVLRFQLRYRMYVLKPSDVEGHFYDVTLNERFHLLIQMDPQELDAILYTLKKSFMITDELKLTSFNRMDDIETVAACFLDFNPAVNKLFVYANNYVGDLPKEVWNKPVGNTLEPDHRFLEIYTFNDGRHVNYLLPHSSE